MVKKVNRLPNVHGTRKRVNLKKMKIRKEIILLFLMKGYVAVLFGSKRLL